MTMKSMQKSTVFSLCITGGIACGKSLVAGFLVRMGVPVIEADVVCHDLVRPGCSAHAAVVRAFGKTVLAEDGQLDRGQLGRIVFDEPERMAELNAILHPLARHAIAKWIRFGADCKTPGALARHANVKYSRMIAAAVVPLVYEAGWESDWDCIACVFAPPSQQRRYLAERGLNASDIKKRLDAQWAVTEKARMADVVIFNAGDSKLAEEQTRRIVQRIKETLEE